MVKVWIETTRKELTLLTHAARMLGVTVSQFVRGVVRSHSQRESPKIPPQRAESPGTVKLPRKRKG